MIRRAARIFLLLAACIFALPGCYQTYSAEAITATVVDAETKQPLAGVIVDAHWEMKGGLEGGNVSGNVMVMEAVTDAAGSFHFPAWGPKTVKVGLSNAALHNSDPELILFKSGYKFETLANELDMKRIRENPRVRTSDWNGKTIELKKFEGTLNEYEAHINHSLPSYVFGTHCDWRNVPAMLRAIRDETKALEKAHIAGSNLYTDLMVNNGYGCGRVEQFLSEHEKQLP